ncbi:MAG: aminotransferase class I/II-fold pyridoxal phosphate-dependent enzyme [Lachnospiraceae bacterium]|nr:aminotransferase class I/II-fold pyridoxal phosphate-dependent enzyme [Lachnospiraceae bacterium]
MKSFKQMTKEELLEVKEQLDKEYSEAAAKGLKLDMSRGKPSSKQLDLTRDMLDVLNSESDMISENGLDIRNYGVLDGIPEAKKIMADILQVSPDNVIVCGNASLNIMYTLVSNAYSFGVLGNEPWCKQENVKFLCPAPGYDRHFAISELFGFELITIPMKEDGPDMDLVEKYVNNDPSVKGIWTVPKYSNPQGVTYSDEVVKRFAALKPAAKDFRIFWDNAYIIHDLYDDKKDTLLNIFDECKKTGNENLVYEFCSTSKVTFAGAGISAVAASDENIAAIKKVMGIQTIGFDKINQMMHARYFKNVEGVYEHMKKHASLLRPKFEAVLNIFNDGLKDLDIATWTNPLGGYFISFESMTGCAKAIVDKCAKAGVKLTGAGATFPYKKDPNDSNIRIAPSFPTEEEMSEAAKLFVLCVKIVSAEKLLENM